MGATTNGPTISRISGDAPSLLNSFDLGSVGYVEREYLIEGTATSFDTVGDRTADGRWTVTAGSEASFASRFLVRLPEDPRRFSGTVVVEWNNVSAGMDGSPDWSLLHRNLMARGHAWVGVSAQKAGIDGGGLAEGMHLKKFDSDRYHRLYHPGDAWSYDIFTQVAAALRRSGDDGPLGELVPVRLIAAGESQSAFHLVTYVNGIDVAARVFDGFFVHGRGANGAALDGTPIAARGADGSHTERETTSPERIRDDARVPVLVLQSETDVIVLGGAKPAQPDGPHLRLWEIAGAAHADTYMLIAGGLDDGRLGPARLAELLQPTTQVLIGTADTPINAGPQQHYVGQAAFEHLVRWVAGGPPPPRAPRLALSADGQLVPDAHGIATGGVRTPWVDVPTAKLSGLGQTGEMFMVLFGTTEPFDRAKLSALYPAGLEDYMAAFAASLDQAINAGFLLGDDRSEILALAGASYTLQTS